MSIADQRPHRTKRKRSVWTAILTGLLGLLVVVTFVDVGFRAIWLKSRHPWRDFLGGLPGPSLSSSARVRLELAPLTDELRRKGFAECNPHDPLGLGPYAPYRTLAIMGQILIPQKGGHTDDMGYDVIVHFHGHEPARKMLVQVARGVTFVGIERGILSGPYAEAFKNPGVFPAVRRAIENNLKAYSNDERAHIRHLALAAWSAGYGSVTEILKRNDSDIDAVVLLDGLHASWKLGHRHDDTVDAVDPAFIQPAIDYARRALRGEKIFIFTHSHVDPMLYPSTWQTADLLLAILGLDRKPVEPGDDPFGMVGRVDRDGFHLWSYQGNNEAAHCTHLRYIARAVRDVLEVQWDTPPMDRTVPPTPPPRLGGGDMDGGLAAEASASGTLDDTENRAVAPATAETAGVPTEPSVPTASVTAPGASTSSPAASRDVLHTRHVVTPPTTSSPSAPAASTCRSPTCAGSE